MRYLLAPILWIAALVIAIVILRRVRRGRKVVLTGRFSPKLVRMIVVVLVILGVGDERQTPTANAFPLHPLGNAGDPLPTTVNENTVQNWLSHNLPGSGWQQFKKEVTQLTLRQPKKI